MRCQVQLVRRGCTNVCFRDMAAPRPGVTWRVRAPQTGPAAPVPGLQGESRALALVRRMARVLPVQRSGLPWLGRSAASPVICASRRTALASEPARRWAAAPCAPPTLRAEPPHGSAQGRPLVLAASSRKLRADHDVWVSVVSCISATRRGVACGDDLSRVHAGAASVPTTSPARRRARARQDPGAAFRIRIGIEPTTWFEGRELRPAHFTKCWQGRIADLPCARPVAYPSESVAVLERFSGPRALK
jgi:hypothetical protein